MVAHHAHRNNASVPFSLLWPYHLVACRGFADEGPRPGSAMIRKAAVAGQFYPANPETLRSDLSALTQGKSPPARPRGVALMVPHAGYMYSGRVAGETYTAARLAKRAVILCPNHTGLGEAIAVNDEGDLETPLGRVLDDVPLARAGPFRFPGARSRR